ncbi:MAG: hypothetical protein KKE62_15310 [Proteobacteria bacterium]|nr:hypothetical protein [Pseudomonadota bacterium]MBU1387609.1 hypothetical protein [Pseudomonadota bacterium]MBU1544200.1 hypothetical protein [Pseudomonadota bacterium]MBU2430005.1 hypothetical protein [Pseudomonadota bacterium]
MTHENKKDFAKKHPADEIDETLSKIITEKAVDQRITCHAAHDIAEMTGTCPADIGKQIDLVGYRLTKCQLGLFGYKNKKKLNPEIDIPPELNQKIDAAAVEGRISCLSCWEIAQNFDLHRLFVSSACEKKGLRIKPCQLGAF